MPSPVSELSLEWALKELCLGVSGVRFQRTALQNPGCLLCAPLQA